MSRLGLDVRSITHGVVGFESDGRMGRWIEVGAARQLWHNACRLSDDLGIGLKVGQMLSLRAFNVLAPVLSHSPNLIEAITNALRFQLILSQSGEFRHEFKDRSVRATYHPAASHISAHHAQIDSVVVGLVRALRLFVSEEVRLEQVFLTGPPRSGGFTCESFFQCPVSWFSPIAMIVFSGEFLHLDIQNTDPGIYQINKALAEDRLSRLLDEEQLVASVGEVIANLQFARANIDEVAAEMLLSPRTLQRRLKESGSSFRKLQEQVILKESTQLLLQTARSVNEVSEMMGYAEVSSFSRAFKSMLGMSPIELRESGCVDR